MTEGIKVEMVPPSLKSKIDGKFGSMTQTPGEKVHSPTGAKSMCRRNPFKLPDKREYGKILQEEKQNTQLKFKKMLSSPVHLKTPARYPPPTNVMSTIPPLPNVPQRPPSPTAEIKTEPDFMQAVHKNQKLQSEENVTEFIQSKREMFLIKYIIGVNRDNTVLTKEKEREKERVLVKSEKSLEEDAIKFNDYLRVNDKEAVEAVKQAEIETRVKLEKVADIKKLNVLISLYKSKITKQQDILLEYKQYAKFLNSVAPQEWISKKRKEKRMAFENKAWVKSETAKEQQERYEKSLEKGKRSNMPSAMSSTTSVYTLPSGRKSFRRPKDKSVHQKDEHDIDDQSASASTLLLTEILSDLQLSGDLVQYVMDDDDSVKEEVYFTSPDQLPAIFAELEEQNLSLIQRSQETEDMLEEMQINILRLKRRMIYEKNMLLERVHLMEHLLEREVEKCKEFEILCKLYLHGRYHESDQDVLMLKFSNKIKEVYTKSLGPNDANLNTIQMMTCIESKLEELLQTLEQLPSAKIAAAMHIRARQRHRMQLVAKAHEFNEYQEQRRRQTMSKAMAIPPTDHRRKLIARSRPPVAPKEVIQIKGLSREEDEHMYFFT